MAQLPNGGVEGDSHGCIRHVRQQGAKFDPWVPGGVATRPGRGCELPGIALSQREEPTEPNQAVHEILLGELGSRGGGDLLKKGAGHYSRLTKLQLLNYRGYTLWKRSCLHRIAYHVSILRNRRPHANIGPVVGRFASDCPVDGTID
jgi:hypothetical protein